MMRSSLHIDLSHAKITNPIVNYTTNHSPNHLPSPNLTLSFQRNNHLNVDPNHQHNSSFLMLNSPSPRMIIASPKLISPSPRTRSPKLMISPSAELAKMNHHNPSSKSSPKHSSPMMSYTNHHHHDAMESGFKQASSNIADKMVSDPTNSSDDMIRAVDMSISSGEEERADESNVIPVNSPMTLTNPSPSPPNHPQLAREYSLGPLQETLDAIERNQESGPIDCMLPSSANITLQALERLMDDDDEISGSNHGVSSSDISNESLQELMYNAVSSRLLMHAYIPHQSRTLESGYSDWLRSLLPKNLNSCLDRHVAMVINGKEHINLAFDRSEFTQVCKFDLGKMYAASVMQGHFLARVHRRFKLEKKFELEHSMSMDSYMEEHGQSLNQLRAMQCTQTVNVIERHVETLFGKASIHAYACDNSGRSTFQSPNPRDIVDIQLGSIENLILHALTFGVLLWDAECYFIPHDCYGDTTRHHNC